MLYIYPYKKGSKSVSNLKEGLKAKIIRLDNSNFKGGNKNVINWGNSTENFEVEKSQVLNPPRFVKNASNKLNFFKFCKDVYFIPEFTTSKEEALKWVKDNKRVCIRTKLTGHSGEGLSIIHSLQEWEEFNHNEAKLYVLYIPKIDEYRVHVFKDKVIDLQKKSTRKGDRAFCYEIRSHRNGFIFTRGNIEDLPKGMTEQCISVIKDMGLDFGAVDVIYNKRRDQFYLLEINTAPGLENTTLNNYIKAFADYYNIDYNKINQEEQIINYRNVAGGNIIVNKPQDPFEIPVNWVERE